MLVNAYARILEDYDYPFGFPPQLVEQFVEDLTEPGADETDDLPLMAPSLASDADPLHGGTSQPGAQALRRHEPSGGYRRGPTFERLSP